MNGPGKHTLFKFFQAWLVSDTEPSEERCNGVLFSSEKEAHAFCHHSNNSLGEFNENNYSVFEVNIVNPKDLEWLRAQAC